MDQRFELRKEQLLADCQVPPAAFRGAIRRLEAFAQPFIVTMPSPETQEYSRIYLAALLSEDFTDESRFLQPDRSGSAPGR